MVQEFNETELGDQERFRWMVDKYHQRIEEEKIRLMVEFHFLEVMFRLTDQLYNQARDIENRDLERRLVESIVPEYTHPVSRDAIITSMSIIEHEEMTTRRINMEQDVLPTTPYIIAVHQTFDEQARTTRYTDNASVSFARFVEAYHSGFYNEVASAQIAELPNDAHSVGATNPDAPSALQAKNRRRVCPVEGIPIHQFDSKSASPQEGAA